MRKFLLLCIFFVYLSAMDNKEIVSNFLIGLFSSITAVVILGISIVKPYLNQIKEKIEMVINPVNEFTDANMFFKLLNESIKTYNGDFSKLVLYRCLPCEFSNNFLSHMGISDTKKELIEYQNLINSIIKDDKGSFDKTIFGRTKIEVLDKETLKMIQSHYFSSEELPKTTDLGLHTNLDEIGVILLGVTESSSHIGEIVWKYGFLIIYSSNFKQIRGFRHNVPEHIRNLSLIFNQKQNDSKFEQHYFNFDEFKDRSSETIFETFKDFYTRQGEKLK